MEEADFQELQKNSEEFLLRNLFLQICISVVKESLDQLYVLKSINNWPEEENMFYNYKTLEQRFSDKTSNSNVKLKSASNSTSLRNSVFVHSLMTNLLNELAQKGSYQEFENALETFHQMKSDEENLLIASEENKKEVNKLRIMLSEENSSYIDRILNCMAEIGKIKDDTENFQIEGGMKLRYVTAWTDSQIEMCEIQSNQKNKQQQEMINRTNIDFNQEERVHQEILLAYDWFQKELESKLEEWKDKYKTDMETFNSKIETLQQKQDQQLDKISNMRDLFSKRQKEIEDYKQYKIEQEKLRKEMEKNIRAATKVQAWWRGTMVRKGFGKYRKKKEKKVKKRSSEKKSGK